MIITPAPFFNTSSQRGVRRPQFLLPRGVDIDQFRRDVGTDCAIFSPCYRCLQYGGYAILRDSRKRHKQSTWRPIDIVSDPLFRCRRQRNRLQRANLLGSGSGIPRTYAQQFWPMTGNDLMACCLARHQAGAPSFIRSRVQRAPDMSISNFC